MSKIIKIGTRESQLALWQARLVQQKMEKLGYETKIVPITSKGDQVLDIPLYEMGITGIFTKTLDIALLQEKIDIAVHSMKDVPTKLPKGVQQVAVLERANVCDILVYKNLDFLEKKGTIATGSLRRKAQWLHQYPKHEVVNLRGNVNTRLQKLKDNNWDAAIFAYAGLERIDILPENHQILDWMIPAPAQGAITVQALSKDELTLKAVSKINHQASDRCTFVERQFLATLEGGCTAPIGAYAKIEEDKIYFVGALFSLDGRQKIIREVTFNQSEYQTKGSEIAQEILVDGGQELMQQIREATQPST